jgi:hypothetical protein
LDSVGERKGRGQVEYIGARNVLKPGDRRRPAQLNQRDLITSSAAPLNASLTHLLVFICYFSLWVDIFEYTVLTFIMADLLSLYKDFPCVLETFAFHFSHLLFVFVSARLLKQQI